MTIQRIALLLAVVLAAPAAAYAQASSSRLPVEPGQRVWITTTDGSEIAGTVGDFTTVTIDIEGANGTKRLNVMDIRRIATRRSLKPGALIGGCVLGGLWGLGAAGMTDPGQGKVAAGLTLGAVGFGVGGGIGALVSWLVGGRHTVYERPAGSPGVRLAPIVSPRAVGIGGAVTW